MLLRVIPHAGRGLYRTARTCVTKATSKPPDNFSTAKATPKAVSKKIVENSDKPSTAKQKRRKNPQTVKTKKPSKPNKSPSHESTGWTGLSLARQRRMRSPPGTPSKHFGLSIAIQTALTCPRTPLQFASRIAHAADIPLPAETHAKVVNLTVNSARSECSKSANAADVSVEAYLRLVATSGSRPTSSALAVVARYATHDPKVDRRGDRAASILRFLINNRLELTTEVLLAVFDAFVSALDFNAAYHLLTYAHDLHPDLPSSERVYWYDRMMFAALLRRQFALVEEVGAERDALRLPTTAYGQSLALSLKAERGDDQLSEATARRLIRQGTPVQNFALASLIRAAGSRRDIHSVRFFYQAFEQSLENDVCVFDQSLSVLSKEAKSAAWYSELMTDVSRTDPTLAVFHALRVCGEAEEAVTLMRRLRSQYGVPLSKYLHTLVSETCFRARRMDLAVEFRNELQRNSEDSQKVKT